MGCRGRDTLGTEEMSGGVAAVLTLRFQFGAGRRVCLGKNIALLEIKKLVPALVLSYEVSCSPLFKITAG